MNGRVFREHQRQTCFTHRWPRGNDDQILLLQTRSHLIEICKARSQSGQDRGPAFHLLDLFQKLFGDRLNMDKALANTFVSKLKYRVLRVIENDFGLVFLLQSFLRDLVRRAE